MPRPWPEGERAEPAAPSGRGPVPSRASPGPGPYGAATRRP